MLNKIALAGRFGLSLLLLLMIIVPGCSRRPQRVHPPTIDADSAGKQAIQLFDTDGDGQLSRAELSACPGILNSLSRFDKDNLDSVDADAITARIREWQATRIGIMTIQCRVTLDGVPLSGANVKLIPETFLGDSIQPASGVSDTTGGCSPAIAAEDLPDSQQGLRGVQIGLYKAEITHPDRELPSWYNVETELGCEIAPEMLMDGVVFALSSR